MSVIGPRPGLWNQDILTAERDKYGANDTFLGSELLYIRAGRKLDTKSFSAKALFALYTYGHMQWAYNRFNNQNLTNVRNVDRKQIYSVVVRCKDDPEMIAKFVEQIPDNTCKNGNKTCKNKRVV